MLGSLLRFPGGPGPGPGFGGPVAGYGPGLGHPPFFPLFGLMMAAGWAVVLVLLVIAVWRILERSGHPGPLGLLMVVPFVNVGLLAYLAFAPWPALASAVEPTAPAAPAPSDGMEQPTLPLI